jgi:hypothetical protein
LRANFLQGKTEGKVQAQSLVCQTYLSSCLQLQQARNKEPKPFVSCETTWMEEKGTKVESRAEETKTNLLFLLAL